MRAVHHARGGFVADDGFLRRIPFDLAAGADGDVAEVAHEVGLHGGVDIAHGRAPGQHTVDKVAVVVVVLEQMDFAPA